MDGLNGVATTEERRSDGDRWYEQRSPLRSPAATPARARQAMYLMHKYWARKPWYFVRQCIEQYSQPGDVVLDPFCGSGVTVAEALAAGRQGVGNDLNPAAVLLTRLTCAGPVDLAAFDAKVARVAARAQAAIMDLYTVDERCPRCGAPLVTDWVGRGEKWLQSEATGEGSQLDGPMAALICPRGCRGGAQRRPLTAAERARLAEREQGEAARAARAWLERYPLYYPTGRRFDKKRRHETLADLFSSRNLLALAILRDAIAAEAGPPPGAAVAVSPGGDQQASSDSLANDLLWLAFSSASHLCSSFRAPGTGHWAVNGLYVPPDWIDENVWLIFSQRLARVRAGKAQSNVRIGASYQATGSRIGRGSAAELSDVPTASVDYVFTDPPYGDSIQYFELSYLWNCLLGLPTEHDREVIINQFQGKDLAAYQALLTAAFREVYRVLRPGRWLTVTFANRDSRVWDSLLAACAAAGFELVNITTLNPISRAYNQIWAQPAPKTDLVINFWRPAVNAHKWRELTAPLDLTATIRRVATELIAAAGTATTSAVCEGVVREWIASRYDRIDPFATGFTSDDIVALLAQEFTRIEDDGRDARWTAQSQLRKEQRLS